MRSIRVLVTAWAVCFSASASGQLATGQAAVAYDPADGSVLLELGDGVIGAAVVSQLNLLDVASLDTTTDLGEPSQTGSEAIAFSATSGLPAGVFDLGSIVDPGLSLAELGNFGVSFSGFGTQGFSAVTVVPEPASAGLLLAGLSLMAVRRRRG